MMMEKMKNKNSNEQKRSKMMRTEENEFIFFGWEGGRKFHYSSY